ncbi:BamA/TamA family outer membrane protein [Agaribacterium sp. ZY112]|uniref:BamA/TamA family outer membrane protein n=1 Tax=Agaribacterium sp. ZY112 TaxID=3233574 RepID=UPI003525465F
MSVKSQISVALSTGLTLALCSSSLWANSGDYDLATNDRNKTTKKMARDKGSDGAWMAVPIPFANPTLGAGLQAAVLYLHEQKEPGTPNATSGIGGMYADSKSYFLGVFHDDYWKSDRFRFSFLAGTGKLNLNYYGPGDIPLLEKHPLGYGIQVNGLYTKLLTRLPYTESWYGGFEYAGSQSTVSFDLGQIIDRLPVIDADVRTSGLGPVLSFDSRDDNYYPSNGQIFNAKYSINDEGLGSDFNFRMLKSDYRKYFTLIPKNVLALKAQIKAADGEIPFFIEPTLSMRGFDVARYRDNVTASMHAEWRYKFHDRWGAVAFAETGAVADNVDELSDGTHISSAGVGIRWQATKAKKINLGIDIAVSTDDQAVYIRAGEAF